MGSGFAGKARAAESRYFGVFPPPAGTNCHDVSPGMCGPAELGETPRMSGGAGAEGRDRDRPRLLGIFAAWRLRAYGLAVAALYVALLGYGCRRGLWPVNGKGVPTSSDFIALWLAGREAVHGHAALVYDPDAFVRLQQALVGPSPGYFPDWSYPPPYLLLLAPLGALPYVAAFFTYELATLSAFLAVVCLIVRRRTAITLVLASPFTAWNLVVGQSGFLTASLVGAALLALERRPMLAGVFLGCLTYKPQLGVLFPVALVAAREWRALLAAAATTALLVGGSIIAFGADPWALLPRDLGARAGFELAGKPDQYWGLYQTVYGVLRYFGGGRAAAALAQGLAALAIVVLVWVVWRSHARYPLKAAILSAAMLLAPHHVLAYDLAAIAIPVAFLAKDQLGCGLRRGEQTSLLALFAASFSVFPTAGRAPVGLAIVLLVLCLALRRARPAPGSGNFGEFQKNFCETNATAGDCIQ
jgi:arabinofuranan 3-O-arabinosyltransferase